MKLCAFRKTLYIIFLITSNVFLIGLPISPLASAQALQTPDIGQKPSQEPYSYVMEGRTDPFRPFISPKAAQPAGLDPNEIMDEDKVLTGLQLFEPGQLTLVGVLLDESRGSLGMVEDETHKGYIVKEGTPIGRRGVVTKIEDQRVIITETSRTRAGKEITNTITMRLKSEGEK